VAAWYPNAGSYFVEELAEERPLFQGDVLRGVPTAFVDHPESHARAFAAEDPPTAAEAERALTAQEIRGVTAVKGGYVVNGEDRRGHPASLTPGEALPAADGLPTMEELERNGVTALTGGDDVERAASTWGRTRSADLCGDQTAAARMSGRVLPETTRSAP